MRQRFHFARGFVFLSVLSLALFLTFGRPSEAPTSSMGQLRAYLSDIPNLSIHYISGVTVLSGTVDSPKQIEKISNLVESVNPQIRDRNAPLVNLVQLSEKGIKEFAERIEREIGSPEIVVRIKNQYIILEGVADNDFEADRSVEIAKTHISGFARLSTEKASDARSPSSKGNTAPLGYNPNGLPTTILDMLRVRPKHR